MPNQLARSITDASLDASEAISNAAITVANRVPIFLRYLIAPSEAGLNEFAAAASEKVAAAVDGTVAVWSAWQTAVVSSLFTPPTPGGYALHAVELARVAARPAQRRVRANADRFTYR